MTLRAKYDRAFEKFKLFFNITLKNSTFDLSEYYLLEFVAMCWMGNQYRIVLYAPSVDEIPDACAIAARHHSYDGENSVKRVEPEDLKACGEVGANMVDISRF